MRMQLDRRSDLARRAEDALVVAFPLLGAVYLALEWGLTRLMGGYWGGWRPSPWRRLQRHRSSGWHSGDGRRVRHSATAFGLVARCR